MQNTNGYIKIFIDLPSSVSQEIPEKYTNKPARHGITVAYGDCSDQMHLVGQEYWIKAVWIVEGERTCFFTVAGLSGLCLDAPHITLGWVDGAAPVVALFECQQYLAGTVTYRVAPAELQLLGVAEFIPFKD